MPQKESALKSRPIPFDNEKFKRLLRAKGLRSVDIATEMGYGKSFFSRYGEHGGIPVVVAKYLETQYGIKPEDYSPSMEEEQAMSMTDVEMFRAALIEVMRSEEFRVMVFNIMSGAIEKALNE